jgi:hypothetical protein
MHNVRNTALALTGIIILAIACYGCLFSQSPSFKSVVAATSHVCVLDEANGLGCFRNGEHTIHFVARGINSISQGRFANYSVADPAKQVCGQRSDATYFCVFPDNETFQLSKLPSSNLEQGKIIEVVRLRKEVSHEACALHRDGTVWCALDGQEASMTQMAGLAAIQKLVGGLQHMCALNKAGQVLCWGVNRYGQLGTDGARLQDNLDVSVAKIDAVTDLVAGADTTCAVRANHHVLCWGRNESGQFLHADASAEQETEWESDGKGHRVVYLAELWSNQTGVNRLPLDNSNDATPAIGVAMLENQVCLLKPHFVQCSGDRQLRTASYHWPFVWIEKLKFWMQPPSDDVPQTYVAEAIPFTKIIQAKTCPAADLTYLSKPPDTPLRCVAHFESVAANRGDMSEPKTCSSRSHCGKLTYLDAQGGDLETKPDHCSVHAECVAGEWKVKNFSY